MNENDLEQIPSTPVFVLVHGAWHGASIWEPVQTELARRGWASTAVALPSSDPAVTPAAGLQDDADEIQRAIDAAGRSVVLVAHSYGGIPGTVAAARIPHQVARLVYLAAFRLPAGQSMTSYLGPIEAGPDGRLPIPGDPAAVFYNGVETAAAAHAARRLTTQSAQSFSDPIADEFEPGATTFVVTDDDRILPAALQETMAAGADRILHLATGHSPFLSAPAATVDLLIAEAQNAR